MKNTLSVALIMINLTAFSQAVSYDTLFSFVPGSTTGIFPNCIPILGNDGKIYGTAERGGQYLNGTLYSYDPIADSLYTEHEFLNGRNPMGGIAQDKAGFIYGTTNIGCSTPNLKNGDGTFFRFDPKSKKVKYLKYFTYNDTLGNKPRGGVMIASNGSVFGTTFMGGGNSGSGALFEYIPSQDTMICRYQFGSGNVVGRNLAPLIQYDSLYLIGAAYQGGNYSEGCIYRYNISTHHVDILYSFNGLQGSPNSNMMLASDSAYYGASYQGAIYKYDSTVKVIKDKQTSYSPISNLVEAFDGNIYGLAQWSGGSPNYKNGVIFKYNPNLNSYTDSVVVMTGENGLWPKNGLVYYPPFESIYGTTYLGGKTGHGVFFKFNPTLFRRAIDLGDWAHLYDFPKIAVDGATGKVFINSLLKLSIIDNNRIVKEIKPTSGKFCGSPTTSALSNNFFTIFNRNDSTFLYVGDVNTNSISDTVFLENFDPQIETGWLQRTMAVNSENIVYCAGRKTSGSIATYNVTNKTLATDSVTGSPTDLSIYKEDVYYTGLKTIYNLDGKVVSVPHFIQEEEVNQRTKKLFALTHQIFSHNPYEVSYKIYKVDLLQKTVTDSIVIRRKKLPIRPSFSTGYLALDPINNRLFLTSDDGEILIIDAENMNIIERLDLDVVLPSRYRFKPGVSPYHDWIGWYFSDLVYHNERLYLLSRTNVEKHLLILDVNSYKN